MGREHLLATIAENREVAAASPSPFYVALLDHMARCVRTGGPTWTLLEQYADEPATEYYPFRALAGVHYEVLTDVRPHLASHYPSTGGDGDADAAWPGVQAAFAGQDADVLADLGHPLQTNETSRCGALIVGFCEVARHTGLALRVREIGASAGLNLHFDRYFYEAGGLSYGPADSAVRFVDYWHPDSPPLDAAPRVVDRRGCDLNPIDAASQAGRLELLSYLWPDETGRIAEMRAALAIAANEPVTVDRASADDWLGQELADLPEGAATVVYHSIVWVYLPEDVQRRIESTIRAAGGTATASAPLGWLRYEEAPEDPLTIAITLTMWPGGEERRLGTGRHHRHPVRLGP